jgi:peptidoglycan/LPS O-acetylase OafA/YrhL
MSARRKLPGLDATRFYAASAIVFFHLIGVGKVAVPESLSFVGVYFGFAVPLFYIMPLCFNPVNS